MYMCSWSRIKFPFINIFIYQLTFYPRSYSYIVNLQLAKHGFFTEKKSRSESDEKVQTTN